MNWYYFTLGQYFFGAVIWFIFWLSVMFIWMTVDKLRDGFELDWDGILFDFWDEFYYSGVFGGLLLSAVFWPICLGVAIMAFIAVGLSKLYCWGMTKIYNKIINHNTFKEKKL